MPENRKTENLVELLSQLKADGVPKEQYKERIDFFLHMKARKARIPLYGQLELTPICNLNCKMCYVHLLPEQMKGHAVLSTEQWKKIIFQAKSNGMIRVNLTGGECLTHPGFKEIYTYLQELGVYVSINTNGVLLDENIIELLKKYPPTNIQVTLYGSNEDEYEKVTGARVFQKVCDHVMRLKSENIPVTFSITPNAYMDHGEAIVEKTFEMGIWTGINGFLIEPNCETERSLDGIEASLAQYSSCFRKKKELMGEKIVSIPKDKLPQCGVDTGEVIRGIQCAAGRCRFQIDWKGMMHACVNAQDMQADLLSLGFEKSWKQIVQQADEYIAPVECENCVYKEPCWLCPDIHKASGREGHCNTEACRRIRKMVQDGVCVL